jgi:hypothetical protein
MPSQRPTSFRRVLLHAVLVAAPWWVGCSLSSRYDTGVDAGPLCTTCGACAQGLPVMGAQHVSGSIDYPDPPPTSGPHNSCWGNWGVQDAELRPKRWVHNLEHGGVVFLYHCEQACPDELQALQNLVQDRPLTVVTAYAALPTRFAAVAWGYRLLSPCFDAEAFAAFYAAHVNHGREAVASAPPPQCAEFPDL